MMPFVGVALRTCDQMHIMDKAGQMVTMRFARIYSPEKIGKIIEVAKGYYWWESNPKAAFMKAVGEVNRMEKEGKIPAFPVPEVEKKPRKPKKKKTIPFEAIFPLN